MFFCSLQVRPARDCVSLAINECYIMAVEMTLDVRLFMGHILFLFFARRRLAFSFTGGRKSKIAVFDFNLRDYLLSVMTLGPTLHRTNILTQERLLLLYA